MRAPGRQTDRNEARAFRNLKFHSTVAKMPESQSAARVMILSFVGRMRRDLVRPQSAGVFPSAARFIAAVTGLLVLTACADPQNNEQFQRQVKRAHECREMQDKLVGKQALTAERVDEITKIMDQAGCTAHLQAH